MHELPKFHELKKFHSVPTAGLYKKVKKTLLTAACIALSRLMSCSIFSLIANFTALWQISVKSAPENPLVTLAM